MGKIGVRGPTALAAVFSLAILLLQFDFNSCKNLSGIVNKSIILSPLNTQPITEIIWKKERNKVIEWESGSDVKSYPPFKGRVSLNTQSGDLHILNLTSLDEGEYEVEMQHSTNIMKFYVTVFDALPHPILGCMLTNGSIKAECEVPSNYNRHRDLLNYSWHCDFPQCERSAEPVLYFDKIGDLSQNVRCFVANPESNKSSSVVLSTCVPTDNSRNRYTLISIPILVICLGLLIKSPVDGS
ncbi:lymphocyte function-associated antigen 3 isoform X2 [Pteronotus mesoamericanus]|uniref:lymphocyte function-associated antigen 3 isoform X2 n=1 Tax=Pteronotus mesoamericanus TaxID=1884717 RepID=UPI0023EA8739|nr:lymphocyte function-associated antigen 3 isoform X2 [Pteronotus parnellii mesoamericanus]